MKRWLAFFCTAVLLIAQCAIGPTLSVTSDDLLLGDVNDDGDVNMKDVLIIRKHIAGLEGRLNEPAADVNADDSVDMKDVLLVRKFIAQLIRTFPASPVEPPLEDLSSKVPFFRYGYDQLGDLEKAAYTDTVDAIEANVSEDTKARDGSLGLTVTFQTPLKDESSVAYVFRAVYADHPEFYFLCSHYSYTRSSEGQATGLLLHYFMNAAEREHASAALLQVVNDWVSALPVEASDVNKELALHDRLCDAVTYPEGDGPYPDAYYSPYSALVDGTAVCDGYARALQLLCLAAEIKTTVVEGFAESGEAHMWNVVYLADEPYYVDPTWDDTLAYPVHPYFNVTTADITSSHTMNFWFPIPPTCTATKYNYYLHTGRYVTTTDGADYAKVVAQARTNNELFSEVRFAPAAMPRNRYLTENGTLYSMVNETLPANVKPLPGYAYSFFDSMNVIVLSF